MNLVKILTNIMASNTNPLSSENFNSELFDSYIHNNSQIIDNKEGHGKSYFFYLKY